MARERGWLRAWLPFGILALALGFWLGAVWAPAGLRGEKGVWLVFPLGGYAVWAWLRAKKVLQRHARGAEGEERVAAVMSSLPEIWSVFHGVPMDSGDLDHVLIGPPGLVVVETIRWKGRVTIRDGRLWDGDEAYPGYEVDRLISRSRAFAERLEAEDIPVHTIVVVAGGRIGGLSGEQEGIRLVDESMLVETLTALPLTSQNTAPLLSKLESLYERPC